MKATSSVGEREREKWAENAINQEVNGKKIANRRERENENMSDATTLKLMCRIFKCTELFLFSHPFQLPFTPQRLYSFQYCKSIVICFDPLQDNRKKKLAQRRGKNRWILSGWKDIRQWRLFSVQFSCGNARRRRWQREGSNHERRDEKRLSKTYDISCVRKDVHDEKKIRANRRWKWKSFCST